MSEDSDCYEMATFNNPTDEELKGFTTMAAIMAHLRFAAPLQEALLKALGALPEDPPEMLGLFDKELLDTLLDAMVFEGKPLLPMARSRAGLMGRYCRLIAGTEPVPGQAAAGQPGPGPVTPAHPLLEPTIPPVAGFAPPMRAAGAASSTTPPVPPQPVDTGRARVADLSAVETVPGTSGASTDVTIQVRKVQLKTTVDQNTEAEVDMLDNLTLEQCHANYRASQKKDRRGWRSSQPLISSPR